MTDWDQHERRAQAWNEKALGCGSNGTSDALDTVALNLRSVPNHGSAGRQPLSTLSLIGYASAARVPTHAAESRACTHTAHPCTSRSTRSLLLDFPAAWFTRFLSAAPVVKISSCVRAPACVRFCVPFGLCVGAVSLCQYRGACTRGTAFYGILSPLLITVCLSAPLRWSRESRE